jgi:hypothetical protein
MATQPPRQVAYLTADRQAPAPQHYVAPSARDLRAQSVHRLQVGLFGLAAMLLLVGLANIIMDRARLVDAAGSVVAGSARPTETPRSDPLADIGVVPAASPSESSAPAATGSPGN